ncbi:MAG TPA: pitrilysin family protein [Kofleriaceae bacterium]
MKRLLALVPILAACRTAPVAPQPGPMPPPQPAVVQPQPQPTEQPMPVVTQTASPQELSFPDEEFRRKQPSATAPRPFKLPAVQPFTLKNGIKVYLVEQHTLPIVSMDLNFDGGGVTDPKGKDGLSSVCMSMLTEGTQKLDKIAYSEALADVASNINAYSTDDSQGVQLASLTKHVDTTFALFAETLLSPGMRDADFDRLKKRRIESVRQSRSNPASIPFRVGGPVLYGADHPLGAVMTEPGLESITLDDCKKQIATWLKPKNARLFVVGDMTEAQVRSTFDKSPLAAWAGAAPKLPAIAAPKTMKGRIFFVHVPNAAQASVSLVWMGPKRTAPDYFANTMLGGVLGGSFTSRINMNLREDKGYAYGARGGFSYPLKTLGSMNVTASVQADSAYQTLLEIDREVKELSTGKVPVKADELDREKVNAELALPSRFSTAQSALGQYRGLVYYGLPLDYYNSYVEKVRKVTEKEIKASAAKHLKTNTAVYVVVGNGDEKMIVDKGPKGAPPKERKAPYEKDGKQLTLREALVELAKKGDVGAGGLVELDVDGRPIAAGK